METCGIRRSVGKGWPVFNLGRLINEKKLMDILKALV